MEQQPIQAPLMDTHCHIYWEGLIERIDEVVAHARAAHVERMVVPGINAETSREAQKLAGRFNQVYFAAGLHPSEVKSRDPIDPESFLTPFAGDPRFVAVGEIGLDFRHRRSGRIDSDLETAQMEAFRLQVEWAAAYDIPVIIHNRDAGSEILSILQEIPHARGVFHCFDGSKRTLRFATERDFFVSYAGNLTYPRAQNLRATLRLAPMDKIVVETDAPWLTPQPRRGSTNEPAYLVETVAQMALALEKSPEIVRIKLLTNSLRLFGIDRS
ncbi:MAG: hypothetical protein B1H03_00530 [Planctomycetales bacterium 4484_113]|nr:MAG: hypothetical protein B1H03_00530 [Planctomycetales bacterium 4484_113]